MARRSLAFVQPYVPEYRVPLFAALAERLAAAGVDLSIHIGDGQTASDARPTPWTVTHHDRLARLTSNRLRWRTGLSDVRSADFVVIEQGIKNVETYRFLLQQSDRPAAMWGHGYNGAGSDGSVLTWLRWTLTRRASWFFSYTTRGRDTLVQQGYPADRITVVWNSTDTSTLRSDLAALLPGQVDRFRRDNGLSPGSTGLFLGQLEEHKSIEYLLEAAALAHELRRDFRLVVAGAGSMVDRVRQAADGPAVVLVGQSFGVDKALVLSASDILIMPRGVGLVAVDALTAGLPVLCIEGAGHGPEADYLVGATATRVHPRADPRDFARAIVGLLDAEDLADRSAEGRRVAEELSMERFSQRFSEGLLAWMHSYP